MFHDLSFFLLHKNDWSYGGLNVKSRYSGFNLIQTTTKKRHLPSVNMRDCFWQKAIFIWGPQWHKFSCCLYKKHFCIWRKVTVIILVSRKPQAKEDFRPGALTSFLLLFWVYNSGVGWFRSLFAVIKKK